MWPNDTPRPDPERNVFRMEIPKDQIQGFFDIPTDNLYGAPVMSADILERHGDKNITVVSPDVGGVVRARALAKRLDDAPLAPLPLIPEVEVLVSAIALARRELAEAVNVGGEASKSGVDPDEIDAFLEAASASDRVVFGGLMCMPPLT